MSRTTIIIIAHREPRLKETLDSALSMAAGPVEALVVLDGHPQRIKDPRVKLIYEPELRGRRIRINQAARIAQGDYWYHLDGHCRSFTRGWDAKLIESIYGRHDKDYAFGSILNTRPRKAHLIQQVGYRRRDGSNDFVDAKPLYHLLSSPALTGCGWLHHRSAWLDFNEQYAGWGYMGIELALKLWLCGPEPAGLCLVPAVVIEHQGRRHHGSNERTEWLDDLITPARTLKSIWQAAQNRRLPNQRRDLNWLETYFANHGGIWT